MMVADNGSRAPAPKSVRAKLRRFIVDRSGATSIEYAVIAAVMTAVVVAAMLLLGPAVSGMYDTIAEAFL